jgi:hypothetical protein
MLVVVSAQVLLWAGPAGAGKSTLARAWCHTRPVAAHVQLDSVRELLVQGLVDPRAVGQSGQPNSGGRPWPRPVRWCDRLPSPGLTSPSTTSCCRPTPRGCGYRCSPASRCGSSWSCPRSTSPSPEVAAATSTSPGTSYAPSTPGPPDGLGSDTSTPPGRRLRRASTLSLSGCPRRQPHGLEDPTKVPPSAGHDVARLAAVHARVRGAVSRLRARSDPRSSVGTRRRRSRTNVARRRSRRAAIRISRSGPLGRPQRLVRPRSRSAGGRPRPWCPG